MNLLSREELVEFLLQVRRQALQGPPIAARNGQARVFLKHEAAPTIDISSIRFIEHAMDTDHRLSAVPILYFVAF